MGFGNYMSDMRYIYVTDKFNKNYDLLKNNIFNLYTDLSHRINSLPVYQYR